jgi:hypothetical protein
LSGSESPDTADPALAEPHRARVAQRWALRAG